MEIQQAMRNLQQTHGEGRGTTGSFSCTHVCITFFNDGWGTVFVTWLRPIDRDRPTDHHVRYLMGPGLENLQDKTETIKCTVTLHSTWRHYESTHTLCYKPAQFPHSLQHVHQYPLLVFGTLYLKREHTCM